MSEKKLAVVTGGRQMALAELLFLGAAQTRDGSFMVWTS